MTMLFFSLLTVTLFLYAIIITLASKGIRRIASSPNSLPSEKISVSIIIPFRNEAGKIEKCLNSLLKMQKHNLVFEIIAVNDNSDDTSLEEVNAYLKLLPLKVLNSNGIGKKSALLTAIEASVYPVILTLDADCIVPEKYLLAMTEEYRARGLEMLCGPITLNSNESVFSELQKAESAAIVGLSAVSLNNAIPTTCNGANLMFSKEAFYKNGGYSNTINLASGDDDLLMHDFFKSSSIAVRYTLNPHALVQTDAVGSLSDLLKQRQRWLSKSKAYVYPYNTILHVLVLVHLLAFYTAIIMFFITFDFKYIGLLALKYLADYSYSESINRYIPHKQWAFLIMPFYLLYIPLVLLRSIVKKADWKGREV